MPGTASFATFAAQNNPAAGPENSDTWETYCRRRAFARGEAAMPLRVRERGGTPAARHARKVGAGFAYRDRNRGWDVSKGVTNLGGEAQA